LSELRRKRVHGPLISLLMMVTENNGKQGFNPCTCTWAATIRQVRQEDLLLMPRYKEGKEEVGPSKRW